MNNSLTKEQIKELLPHREPMLLLDELINIKKLHSATAIVNVTKKSFFVQGHFPGQPVMPGVLIVEAFGQAAAALTANGLDKKTYENKLVFLMNIEKARFRKLVTPGDQLIVEVKKKQARKSVWKFECNAKVDNEIVADATITAMIVD